MRLALSLPGSGANSVRDRRLSTGACVDANPGAACADLGGGSSSLSVTHASTAGRTHAETHRYALPGANRDIHTASTDRDANALRNADSAPASSYRYTHPAPTHRHARPHLYAQAARAHVSTHAYIS